MCVPSTIEAERLVTALDRLVSAAKEVVEADGALQRVGDRSIRQRARKRQSLSRQASRAKQVRRTPKAKRGQPR